MNKNSKGLAHFFPIFAIVVAGIVGLLYYSWQKGLIKTTPSTSSEAYDSKEVCEEETGKSCTFQNCDYIPRGKSFEEVCGKDFRKGWIPNQNSLIEEKIVNWKTYNALEDGFIETAESNFYFKYPPEFILDHGTGPSRFFGGSSVDLSGDGVTLTVGFVNAGGSTQDQANSFVQGIINKDFDIPINCDLLPSCNNNTFSIKDLTLANKTSVTVVSGPYYNNEVFDLYIIRPNLSFWFTYKDRDKWKQTRDQILSTFKFLELQPSDLTN